MLKRIDALRAKMLNRPLWTALLFFPFFEPVGAGAMFEPLYAAFTCWKLVSLLMVCIFFLGRPRLSRFTIVMGVYQVVLMVSTLINHSGILSWLYKAALTAAICLLVDQCVDTNVRVLIKALFFSLGLLCLANLVTVVLYPGGMWFAPYWFLLGIDNAHALFIIPLLGIEGLYAVGAGWPLVVQLGLAALFSASLFIAWSVTGMLAATAFIVLLALSRVRKSWRLFNIGVYYAVIVAMFLAVVVFRLPEHMSFIMEGLLHKDVTLTNRTPLWAHIMEVIRERPLLGYGKLSSTVSWELLGNEHCHNIILQTLIDAGFVGLAVFGAEMGLLVRPLWRTRSSKCGYILAAAVFSLLVYCMAEGQLYPAAYICLFALSYHAEKLTAVLEPDALPGES